MKKIKTIKISGGYVSSNAGVSMSERHEERAKANRGCGSQGSAKHYQRKNKHKNRDYDY